MKSFLYLFFISLLPIGLQAGEGMWIPLLIEKGTITDMQAAGMKLSSDDIYSINKACLKDAVVLFGRGCTGEIISPDGLLITNHHCGYGCVQVHSTIENNLLKKGFWAYSHDQELPNPGLTVSLLISIEDVTAQVLESITTDMSEKQRSAVIDSNSAAIIANKIKDTHYKAEIESFYFGNDFYLFTYEVFKDIRLVGTPPSSIGRFGGDTDNWIWPRHTGDFCLFRIYAGKNNKPAAFDKDNVPYKPKKHLTLSTQGIREGDFTMIMGYPARTEQYLHSKGLAIIIEEILPSKIEMREERLRIMAEEMSKNPEINLQYAHKYQNVSNAWKKWKGIIDGAARTCIVNKRIRQEQTLATDPQTSSVFKPLLQNLNEHYTENKAAVIASELGNEAMASFEIMRFATDFINKAYSTLGYNTTGSSESKEELKKMANDFFTNVNLVIDRRTMPGILDIYKKSVDPVFLPESYDIINDRYNGDSRAYIEQLFEKSLFTNRNRLNKMIEKLSFRTVEKLLSDPAIRFNEDFSDVFIPYYLIGDSLDQELNRLYRDYVNSLMTFDTCCQYYPDANFTMRLSYGKVQGYNPANAIYYDYYTTAEGLLEKGRKDVADYSVNEKLRQLIEDKDFSPYAVDSTMPVCFIASNHTSGGNSGSPVLDGKGRLIGINFDRNCEGTISDYEFDPSVCRNISLDIRYVLFIIDKYAGAFNILKELTLDPPYEGEYPYRAGLIK
ncbi:MAG: S46 family peptidase [Bacteroidales bacterium]|nr:S46 family peptidase [Bacteroidales bacterium]MBN2763358.1 S46 family peptidase [Bacteroidales bacterium]